MEDEQYLKEWNEWQACEAGAKWRMSALHRMCVTEGCACECHQLAKPKRRKKRRARP